MHVGAWASAARRLVSPLLRSARLAPATRLTSAHLGMPGLGLGLGLGLAGGEGRGGGGGVATGRGVVGSEVVR